MDRHSTYTGSRMAAAQGSIHIPAQHGVGQAARQGCQPIPYPEGNMPADMLMEKLRISYNTEARAGHGAEHLAMWRIGFVDYGNQIQVVYEDEDGNNWHDTMHREADGRIVSETEHIFGADWQKKFCRRAKK